MRTCHLFGRSQQLRPASDGPDRPRPKNQAHPHTVTLRQNRGGIKRYRRVRQRPQSSRQRYEQGGLHRQQTHELLAAPRQRTLLGIVQSRQHHEIRRPR